MERYAAETGAYNRTVALLRSKLGTVTRAEYDQLRKLTEETRLLCEGARLALYRHIREHGC
jgi:YD repeat-containing protein